jgi:hypothetical protein
MNLPVVNAEDVFLYVASVLIKLNDHASLEANIYLADSI